MSAKRKRQSTSNDEPAKAAHESYDLYGSRFGFELEAPMKEMLRASKKTRNVVKRSVPGVGNTVEYGGVALEPSWDVTIGPSELNWNESLSTNFKQMAGTSMTDEQQFYFDVIGRYMDLQAYTSTKDHRSIYLAHAIHHLIRTRNLIVSNKHKLDAAQISGEVSEEMLESCRDQGFARPTILILCPFKKDAYDIVNRLKTLVFGKEAKGDLWNKKRFEEEFASDAVYTKGNDEEYKELMSGNNDDCFRMGIALSKKTLKLFEPFDKSDIILCSPLGLRMILDGEAGKESHLISSLQICVVDGADVMLQQNWEHLNLIFLHMHTQPSQINTDISKVRQLYLEGDGKLYCQLLVFSRFPHDLFTALVMEHSQNYRGLVVCKPEQEGCLDMVEIPLCQELHRFDASDFSEQSEARFKYFKEQIAGTLTPRTCIVIPSYYDFVRIRNHFKRTEESFVSCHEYAPDKKISRALDMFFHERKSMLLVTERFYYFNRRRLRGMERIIFYQLPSNPKFYANMINWADCTGGMRFRATLLYSKFDRTRLQNAFGTTMAAGILGSSQKVQVIVSE